MSVIIIYGILVMHGTCQDTILTYPDELIMAVKLRYQGFIDANYATL